MILTSEQSKDLCHGIAPRGVRQGQMVPLAAQNARVTTISELEDSGKIFRLYNAREGLKKTLQRALPVEKQLIDVTQTTLTSVERTIARLELATSLPFPTLDPIFLGWKTKEGYPAFSVYSLYNPECKIRYMTTANGSQFRIHEFKEVSTLSMTPKLPPLMQKNYLDAALESIFENEARKEGLDEIRLSAQYAGAMPNEVRDIIYQYTEECDPETQRPWFDELFIVAEAPAWSRAVIKSIPIGDPLVVGINRGVLFLLAAYDLSPVEKVVRAVCTSPERISTN